jgi:hypothetical protein
MMPHNTRAYTHTHLHTFTHLCDYELLSRVSRVAEHACIVVETDYLAKCASKFARQSLTNDTILQKSFGIVLNPPKERDEKDGVKRESGRGCGVV